MFTVTRFAVALGICLQVFLALAGCADQYPKRSEAEFIPLRADQAESLVGRYRTVEVGVIASHESLWSYLTTGEPFPSETETSSANLVQIEVASKDTLRLRYIPTAQEQETVVLHGRFEDGYFKLDPIRHFKKAGLAVFFTWETTEYRLGVDRHRNLILDIGGYGIFFFGPLPFAAARYSVYVAHSMSFERVDAAATQEH